MSKSSQAQPPEQKSASSYGIIKVYALEDPDTLKVFYVGQTKRRPEGRLQSHMREAKKYRDYTTPSEDSVFNINIQKLRAELSEIRIAGVKYNVRKCRWIVDILARGKYPNLKILDQWEAPIKQDAHRLEEAWIAHMRSLGHPLTNFIYSHRMNPQWYSKTSKGWKEGWATSPIEYIAMLKEGKVGGTETKTRKPSRRFTRSQMKKYSKRSRKQGKQGKTRKSKRNKKRN